MVQTGSDSSDTMSSAKSHGNDESLLGDIAHSNRPQDHAQTAKMTLVIANGKNKNESLE